jgi:hypothetical protein
MLNARKRYEMAPPLLYRKHVDGKERALRMKFRVGGSIRSKLLI